jgi:cytoskeletal protein CcmA (bactofilin family)
VITYSGTVRIDGHLEGEIHTDGELLIGEDAVITATITAGTVISSGQISGDITAATRVRLNAPAVLRGSVQTPQLAIEEGVLFTGTLAMARTDQDNTEAGQPTLLSPVRLNAKNKAANA